MKTRRRIRRRTARRAPAVRRCACNAKAGTDAKQRLNETRESGLMIGGAKDPAETRADNLAARAMTGTSISLAHRKCAACEAEDKAQRSPAVGVTASGISAVPASKSVKSAVDSMGSGRPLTKGERSFFEPRFNSDFSSVRVHDNASADRAARGMDAEAFTIGTDIGFAHGERSRGGTDLMAHELAHVVDDKKDTARRTVRGNSSCPTSVPGTPPDPMAAIRTADRTALELTLAASTLLFLTAQEPADSSFLTDDIVLAYKDWFRAPPQLNNGKFRARLAGGQFDTEAQAIQAEMTALASRYDRIVAFFGRPIRYRCPNTASFTIPGCARGPCGADSDAESCPGARQIALCNGFWTYGNDKQRANVLFHEAFHAHLRIGGHPVSTNRRLRNPECNAGFMRSLFNITGLTAVQCPRP